MTPSGFKLQFPEFASEADARVQWFIERAAPHFDLDRWGELYADGMAHFVAHSLLLSQRAASGMAGGTDMASAETGRSDKVGEVSVQVSQSEGLLNRQADNPFLRTLYGQQYLYLRRQVGMGAISV